MLAFLFLHGAFLVLVVSFYNRWLDEGALADICLASLAFELLGALGMGHYTQNTNSLFTCQLGSVSFPALNVDYCLILGFDELSGYFFSLLVVALFVCFFFLAEYFEFDAHASAIITLSALFSQAAMLYFCSFDLLLLLAL